MTERDLVDNIRQVLDDSLDQMDQATRSRLFAARREALPPPSPVGVSGTVLTIARHHPWTTMLLLACGLLVAAWFGLRPQPAMESEALDIMLLTGDIPPQAYADWSLVHHEDVGSQCRAVN